MVRHAREERQMTASVRTRLQRTMALLLVAAAGVAAGTVAGHPPPPGAFSARPQTASAPLGQVGSTTPAGALPPVTEAVAVTRFVDSSLALPVRTLIGALVTTRQAAQ